MRAMKRIASVVLAMVMVLAMAVPVMADEPTKPANYTNPDQEFTITISPAVESHVYRAYQIFKGDVYGNTLSNVAWGSGVSTEYKTANNAETVIAGLDGLDRDAETAQTFADTISQNLSNVYKQSDGFNSENSSYTITVTGPGYYLIVDETAPLTDAHSRFILSVVNNQNVTPKSDTPEVEKKVQDVNDSTGDTHWQDSADYDINENISYQLTGTLPSNYDAYESYYFEFVDELSKGLTLDVNSIDVKIGANSLAKEIDYKVSTTPTEDGGTLLKITFENMKNVSAAKNSSEIVVTYKAKLNDQAVFGSTGNNNKVHLVFSNNPNAGGSGDRGQTPDDTVIVFTFDLDVNKVTKDEESLEGAGFTLYKWDFATKNWTVVKEIGVKEGQTTFSFDGLDDGYYKLEETTVPAGYNKADDVLFAIVAEHSESKDAPELESLSVKSLTQTEEGDTVEFTVGGDLRSFSVEKSGSPNLKTNIVNNAGTQLPETGGMGTTIFYVVGAILILGAGILLVTNKRMSK